MMKINMNFRYSFKFILFVYILTALIGGYILGIIAGIAIHIQGQFNLNDGQLSYLIGLVFLGGILAKFFWLSADYIGRKKVIITVLLCLILGTFLFANSTSYMSLTWSRLLQGAAIMLSYYAFPVYMTEIASANKRGRYVALYQLMWAAGIAISSLSVLMFDKFIVWQDFYNI
jgi:MFS family permease